MSTKTSSSDITSLHGIRLLNTYLIILSHKGMQLNFSPIANRTEMNTYCEGPISILFRAVYLYTDVFLMLSGLLVSYLFIGKLQRGIKINVWKEIAGRYFRFMPAIAALIIFSTFILPLLGSGPQWGTMITVQSKRCKRNWWMNFLMIQNWFGFENICMANSHHAATDFVLFVLSIFLIILIHEQPEKGILTVVTLAVVSTVAKFYVVYKNDLVTYITAGTKYLKIV